MTKPPRKPLADEYLALHPETPPALKNLILRYEAQVNGLKGYCSDELGKIGPLKTRVAELEKQQRRSRLVNHVVIAFLCSTYTIIAVRFWIG